jgi:hypothetical protein
VVAQELWIFSHARESQIPLELPDFTPYYIICTKHIASSSRKMCKVMTNFKDWTERKFSILGFYPGKNTASEFGADQLWAGKIPHFYRYLGCNYRD